MSPLPYPRPQRGSSSTETLAAPSAPQPGARPGAQLPVNYLLPLLQGPIRPRGAEADRDPGAPRMSSRRPSREGGSLRARVQLAEQLTASYGRRQEDRGSPLCSQVRLQRAPLHERPGLPRSLQLVCDELVRVGATHVPWGVLSSWKAPSHLPLSPRASSFVFSSLPALSRVSALTRSLSRSTNTQ